MGTKNFPVILTRDKSTYNLTGLPWYKINIRKNKLWDLNIM